MNQIQNSNRRNAQGHLAGNPSQFYGGTMNKNERLDMAIKLAVNAHHLQVDKGGMPYILHPLRVMLACETEDERIVAVLHDVIEDTPTKLEAVAMFGNEVRDALVALTHLKSETYQEYIERVGKNELAATVKLHDLADNMSTNRLHNIDQSLYERYAKARNYLIGLRSFDGLDVPAEV